MKPLLARAHRSVIEQFAWSKVLVAFDFDGTLAPIVREPSAAKMRRSTHARLIKVARRYPCCVISGRARADVQSRLPGVPLVEVVGNHGLETARAPASFSRSTKRWVKALHVSLEGAAGVDIEDKGASIAIHYRKARKRVEVKAMIDRAVRALDGDARVIPGKLVVNVLPDGGPHKGIALQRTRAAAQADTAIYVGDDVTDEDVFSLDEPGRLLSIRVGQDATSAASYYLDTQGEIDVLLERLIACRQPAGASTGGRLGERGAR